MKRIHLSIPFISTLILLLACRETPANLKPMATLPGSTGDTEISFFKNQIYFTGSNSSTLWVLDSLGVMQDSIVFNDSLTGVSAMTDVRHRAGNFLILMESGSSKSRTHAWKINLPQKKIEKFDLTLFYERLTGSGIQVVNIEGLVATENGIILLNRGNEQYPKNHLIFTEFDFWKNPAEANFDLIICGHSDSSQFKGVSSIEYAYRTGHLYLAVSGVKDGYSSIWMIPDIVSKRNYAAVNPHKTLDLTEEFPEFKNLTIHSLAVCGSTKNSTRLLLSTSNDVGQTNLFELDWLKH